MRHKANVAVIIPALNEEPSIGKVVAAIPGWVDDVIVVDNGSADRTADVARSRGARVVSEARRGYGLACLAGLAALRGPDHRPCTGSPAAMREHNLTADREAPFEYCCKETALHRGQESRPSAPTRCSLSRGAVRAARGI